MSTAFFKRPVVRHIAAGSMLAASVLGLSYTAHGYWSDPHDVRVSIPVAESKVTVGTYGFIVNPPTAESGVIEDVSKVNETGMLTLDENTAGHYFSSNEPVTGKEVSELLPGYTAMTFDGASVYRKLIDEGSAKYYAIITADTADHRGSTVSVVDTYLPEMNSSGLVARKGFVNSPEKCDPDYIREHPEELQTESDAYDNQDLFHPTFGSNPTRTYVHNFTSNVADGPDYRDKRTITYCGVMWKELEVGKEGFYKNNVEFTANTTTPEGEPAETSASDSWGVQLKPLKRDGESLDRNLESMLRDSVDYPFDIGIITQTNRHPIPEKE